MPRRRRCIEAGLTYHLISRLVDREWFIQTDEERRDYLRLLARALTDADWRCLAYAVMSNHIHIAAVAGTQTLASWIRRVHAPFATSMNLAYDRIGQMFVRGPKDIPVPNGRIGKVIAYIHNNPVRARVVDHAARSEWTSHRAYVGLEPCPPWLHVDEGLAHAGFKPTDALAFDSWVRAPERIEFEDAYDRLVTEKPPPRPRSCPWPGASTAIVAATASVLGISVEQIRSRRRGSLESGAREVAVYCASRYGLLGTDIAGALGISQQAVSHIIARAARDDVALVGGRVMSRLEGIAR